MHLCYRGRHPLEQLFAFCCHSIGSFQPCVLHTSWMQVLVSLLEALARLRTRTGAGVQLRKAETAALEEVGTHGACGFWLSQVLQPQLAWQPTWLVRVLPAARRANSRHDCRATFGVETSGFGTVSTQC